jgi:hypothetical protein
MGINGGWEGGPWKAPFHGMIDEVRVYNGALTDSMITAIYESRLLTFCHDNDQQKPDNFVLLQNYPNPFNTQTTIHYELPIMSHVLLTIYNLQGQEICNLVDKRQPAGRYFAIWNAGDQTGQPVSSGVYFYRIETESLGNLFTKTEKMILLK